jgi:hypothetical protein
MMFNRVGEVVATVSEEEDEEGVGIFLTSLPLNVTIVMNLGTFNGNVLRRNRFQEDFTQQLVKKCC